MSKRKLATIWLDGCSGCHMSMIDMDQRLIDIVQKYDLVFSPLVDVKEFPEEVDVTLVEGAISSDEDYEKIKMIRDRTKFLVAFGDCAVTGNLPSMRNQFSVQEVLERGYIETSPGNREIPGENIPHLLDKAYPVNRFVEVDLFLQGCPPSADLIFNVLQELAEGRIPDVSENARFG
jgi:NAD-reducing hydrogenase small subunit